MGTRQTGQRRRQDQPFASIEVAGAAIARGDIVVVVDDEDREDEGDLVMAAQFATAEKLSFFVEHTSGLVCVPMSPERCDALGLPPMVSQNEGALSAAFTVTVDARGTSTGISAADRARTIRALASPETNRADLNRPGHVFPLTARRGGVLERPGHTEAAVDLCRLAGVEPVGVIAQVVNRDGSMARRPQLVEFCQRHGLVLVSIADLVAHRHETEPLVAPVAEARIPTRHGTFRATVYVSLLDGQEHVALLRGEPALAAGPPVYVHRECLVGDILRSSACRCGSELDAAVAELASAEHGVLVYVRGPSASVAPAPTCTGAGSPPGDANVAGSDAATRRIATQILRQLGLTNGLSLDEQVDRSAPLGRAGESGVSLAGEISRTVCC